MTRASVVVVVIDDGCVDTHLYHLFFPPYVHILQSVDNKTVFCCWQMNVVYN